MHWCLLPPCRLFQVAALLIKNNSQFRYLSRFLTELDDCLSRLSQTTGMKVHAMAQPPPAGSEWSAGLRYPEGCLMVLAVAGSSSMGRQPDSDSDSDADTANTSDDEQSHSLSDSGDYMPASDTPFSDSSDSDASDGSSDRSCDSDGASSHDGSTFSRSPSRSGHFSPTSNFSNTSSEYSTSDTEEGSRGAETDGSDT